ncbi:UNVERIFIED_CONTAM: hypothetical protein Sangu_1729700 [Sesamum angustifolium]|uniref:Uncharacterized protein n=1 Tax=Sesamum angustifolium TaxID=2727405 RepID=A0AAW2M811_9LAMI
MDGGLDEGAKDPPAWDILGVTLDRLSSIHSTIAGMVGGVGRAYLNAFKASEAFGLSS